MLENRTKKETYLSNATHSNDADGLGGHVVSNGQCGVPGTTYFGETKLRSVFRLLVSTKNEIGVGKTTKLKGPCAQARMSLPLRRTVCPMEKLRRHPSIKNIAVSAVAAETTPGTLVTVMPKERLKGLFRLNFRFPKQISKLGKTQNSKRTFGSAGVDIKAIISGVRKGNQRDAVWKVGDKLLVHCS